MHPGEADDGTCFEADKTEASGSETEILPHNCANQDDTLYDTILFDGTENERRKRLCAEQVVCILLLGIFQQKTSSFALELDAEILIAFVEEVFSIFLCPKLLIFLSFLGDCEKNFVGNSNASAYRAIFSGNDSQQTGGTSLVCVQIIRSVF